MILAKVVLPTPGGPHKIKEEICPASIIRRKIAPFPTRCSCPMYSSKFCGRNLSTPYTYTSKLFFRQESHRSIFSYFCNIKSKSDIYVTTSGRKINNQFIVLTQKVSYFCKNTLDIQNLNYGISCPFY